MRQMISQQTAAAISSLAQTSRKFKAGGDCDFILAHGLRFASLLAVSRAMFHCGPCSFLPLPIEDIVLANCTLFSFITSNPPTPTRLSWPFGPRRNPAHFFFLTIIIILKLVACPMNSVVAQSMEEVVQVRCMESCPTNCPVCTPPKQCACILAAGSVRFFSS